MTLKDLWKRYAGEVGSAFLKNHRSMRIRQGQSPRCAHRNRIEGHILSARGGFRSSPRSRSLTCNLVVHIALLYPSTSHSAFAQYLRIKPFLHNQDNQAGTNPWSRVGGHRPRSCNDLFFAGYVDLDPACSTIQREENPQTPALARSSTWPS